MIWLFSLLYKMKKCRKLFQVLQLESLDVQHFFTCQPRVIIIVHVCIQSLNHFYCCHYEWNSIKGNQRPLLENKITVIHCKNVEAWWIESAWKCKINRCCRSLSALRNGRHYFGVHMFVCNADCLIDSFFVRFDLLVLLLFINATIPPEKHSRRRGPIGVTKATVLHMKLIIIWMTVYFYWNFD